VGYSENRVNQRDITADGDVVGRDKYINIDRRKSQVDGWLEKLNKELSEKPEFREFVDSLQYYLKKYEYDGIKGLKGKLEASDRGSAYLKALRKKEAFAKLLEDWRSFPSAQEIIAYFLSRIDSCFEAHIEPLLGIASNDEIDRAIDRHLVQPVLEEMGTGPFMLNSTHVNGMIYWLAEQCYVRWHQ